MNKLIRSVIIFLTCFTVTFVIMMIFIGSDTEPNQDLDQNLTLSETLEKGFMEGCIGESNNNYSYCKCVYKFLDNNTTDEELIDLSVQYIEDNQTPELLNDAVLYCVD